MTPPVRAADVRVRDGVHEDFLKRHAKDRSRAQEAWAALVAKRDVLLDDCTWGEPIPRRLVPKRLRDLANLFVVPELPHRFRAVYSLLRRPGLPVVVMVEWIGDHKEYDRLFGYRTS